MFPKNLSKKIFAFQILVCILMLSAFSISLQAQTYPQQPYYNQQNDPNGNDENYTAKSPYKLEIAKLEASVYRPGEEPIPLSQIPRLNKGDVLKVKISNEAVNGIMPHQSNWDWTLLVAFINPSRNNATEETVSAEVRLKEKGWYNDNFFTVPYDSQPMIFMYPKPKYRKQILDLISKRPDDVRQMGEKVIEISSAYGHISQFLRQLQFMMIQPEGYGNGLLEQSIEGMARTFGVQLPSCWQSYSSGYSGGYTGGYGGYTGSTGYNSYQGYNTLASKAQCVSRNIRMEDLNYSVGRMLQQGGLMALNQLRQSHPELSKWIAIAAVAIDFIMKLTRKSAIRIIPALVSTPDNPIFAQSYYQGGFYGGGGGGGGYYQGSGGSSYYNGSGATGYYQGGTPGNSFTPANPNDSNKISLLANYQPTDKEFVTVYAYVPHKWQPETDPKLANLYAPQMIEPCFHAGKNILRNMDLRVEWLSDNFTRDFKLVLTDNNGWKKEFDLRKNLGLNAWEAEISKEDIAALPKNNVFDAKITGKRGFTLIESPIFQLPFANGGLFEASIKPNSNGNKSVVTLKRTAGDARCSQNIIYKPATGQPIIFPITKENSFLRMTQDGTEVSFEVEASATPAADTIQVQQYGGESLNVTIKP